VAVTRELLFDQSLAQEIVPRVIIGCINEYLIEVVTECQLLIVSAVYKNHSKVSISPSTREIQTFSVIEP
jgi:hypothetical protein